MLIVAKVGGNFSGLARDRKNSFFVFNRILVLKNKRTPWFSVVKGKNTKSIKNLNQLGQSFLYVLGEIGGIEYVRFAVSVNGNKQLRSCSIQVIYEDNADPDKIANKMKLAISQL